MDFSERARGAGRSVVASVRSITPRWQTNAYGDRLIVSQYGLQVEETLEGAAESSVLVDMEGGTLNGLTLRVSDLPDLKVGDRAVFLLDPTANAKVHVPHRRGLGVLKLDPDNKIRGNSWRLEDIRRMTREARGAKP